MYGHIRRMAEAVKEGADGGERRYCPDLPCSGNSPGRSSDKDGRLRSAKKCRANVPVCEVEDLVWADAIILRHTLLVSAICVVRCASSWIQPAPLGQKGDLSAKWERFHLQRDTACGQESTILSFHITLLHQGMIMSASL